MKGAPKMNGISRADFTARRQTEAFFEDCPDKRAGSFKRDSGESSTLKTSIGDMDTYTPSGNYGNLKSKAAGTKKERSEADMKILKSAARLSNRTVSEFQEMVREFFAAQAGSKTSGGAVSPDIDLTEYGVPKAAADEIERLSAKYGYSVGSSGVGENDFWGVEATAKRIFDFAVSLSGGDAETMAMLQDTVHEAFKGCEKLFEGSLPDISYQTLDRIDEFFGEYAEQSVSDTDA
jgi:hypothetical protein